MSESKNKRQIKLHAIGPGALEMFDAAMKEAAAKFGETISDEYIEGQGIRNINPKITLYGSPYNGFTKEELHKIVSDVFNNISPSEERLLNEVRRDDIADDFLQGPVSINRPPCSGKSEQYASPYLIDEIRQWDRNLFKKAQLNQASLPSEYPSINNMFQEQVLKPKKNE